MPVHPAFRKITLPNSPILRDRKEKTVEVTPLSGKGHRKATTIVQTLKFASGRRPGHHQWFRKRTRLIEIVTYSIYDGDHEDLTTDSDSTDLTGDEGYPRSSSPPASTAFTVSDSSVSGDNDVGSAGGTSMQQSHMTEADVRNIHARMHADADNWAASAIQALQVAPTGNDSTAGIDTTTNIGTNTNPTVNANADSSRIKVPGPSAGTVRIPPTKKRLLGFTLSTAIPVSSDEETQAVGLTRADSGSSTHAMTKRGVTLQGEPSGPPTKKAKTILASETR